MINEHDEYVIQIFYLQLKMFKSRASRLQEEILID